MNNKNTEKFLTIKTLMPIGIFTAICFIFDLLDETSSNLDSNITIFNFLKTHIKLL